MAVHIVGGTQCNMGCTYSALEGTDVLTADLEWVPIESIETDDEVVAFDRPDQTPKNKESKLHTSHVTETWKYEEEAVRVETDKGTIVVGETHPLLSKHHGFREAQQYTDGQEIRYVLEPNDYEENNAYQQGYVHGAFAGDGTVIETETTKNASIRCQDEEIIETIDGYTDGEFGIGRVGTDSNNLHEARTTTWDDVERFREVYPIHEPSMVDDDYLRGWLAGLFDTDGAFDGSVIRFTQNDNDVRAYAVDALNALGYDFITEEDSVRVRGKNSRLELLAEIRPKVSRKVRNYEGHGFRGTATVKNVEHVGTRTFYDVTVDTYHTLVLDGFASHNCYEEPDREINDKGMAFDYDMDAILARLEEYREKKPHSAPGLHGGEPLLMADEDIETLFAYIDEHWDDNPGIQTNGTMVSDRHIELFDKYNVTVGVSCDGPVELNGERKARNGGEDVTEEFAAQTHRTITKLAQAGVSVGIITVLHETNAGTDEKLEKLLSWMDNLNRMGVQGHFNPAIPYDDVQTDVSLSPERLADVYDRCTDWFFEKEYRQWGPFDSMVDNLMGNGLSGCVNRKCDVSNAGAAQIIKSNGEMSGCGKTWSGYADGETFLQGQSSGNEYGEREERYDVLKQLPGPYTEEVQDGQLDDHGGCKGCDYWSVCNGGCPSSGVDQDWRNRTIWCEAKHTAYEKIEERLRKTLPNIQLVTDLPWDADITEEASHGRLDIEPFGAIRPGTHGRSSAQGYAQKPNDAIEAVGGFEAVSDLNGFEAEVRKYEKKLGEENVAVNWDEQTIYTDTGPGETTLDDMNTNDTTTNSNGDREDCGCETCQCGKHDEDNEWEKA